MSGMKKPERQLQIVGRVTKSEHDIIRKLANEQKRSISNFVTLIVSEYCKKSLSQGK